MDIKNQKKTKTKKKQEDKRAVPWPRFGLNEIYWTMTAGVRIGHGSRGGESTRPLRDAAEETGDHKKCV